MRFRLAGCVDGRNRRLLLLFIVFSITRLSAQNALSQDSDRYLPKPSVSPTRPVCLPCLPRVTADFSTDGAAEVLSDEVLIDELKGVMVTDDVGRLLIPIKPFDGLRIDPAADLTVAREDCFAQVVESCVGRPVTMQTLHQMGRRIVMLYCRRQQPVVDVSVPPGQDITDGVVQIVITEAQIGAVRFEGHDCCSVGSLRQQSWLRSGQRIYTSCLQDELVWLNRSPYRDVSVNLQPGMQSGTADVVYHVHEEQPYRLYAGYEDSGTRATGLERVLFGVQLAHLGGRDHLLDYRYTTDAEFGHQNRGIDVHAFSYEVPIFANRDTWTIFGMWGDVGSAVDTPGSRVLTEGRFWQLSGRYRHTLSESSCQVDTLTFGVDTKAANNFADFGGLLAASTTVSDVHLVNFMAGVDSRQTFADGWTHYSMDVFFSPGGLLTNNRAKDFRNTRPGALATYGYARGLVERQYAVNRRSDVMVRLTGQVATGELLPTEQLGLGGYDSVRGYDRRSLNGDNGYILNVEYRSKPIIRCCQGSESSLTLLAFGDLGQQYNWGSDAVLPNADVLASAGVGLRYLIDPHCTVRVDYGVPLTEAPFQASRDHGRLHIGAILAY
ncbi:MAG: ShlB/FhaC/HecB family hemolysin secretion/activation protein [Fuerstiella sp.]